MIAVVLLSALYGIGGFGGYAVPNLHVTPGATREVSKEELCRVGSSRDARHVTLAMKHEVCARYGAKDCPGPNWELDHSISLELGGSNDVTNIWPQPIKEARLKDVLEGFLHRAVCTGAITLPDAQQQIRKDWTRAYERMKNP